MSEPIRAPWSVEQFFAWQAEQPERYELIDSLPVRMRPGAKNVHDDIVVNLLAELRRQLRGSPCRPFTGDGSVETLPGRIRRPDAGIDCGRRDPDAMQAALPRMVAEVLSPTTRDFDAFDKLAEYKQVASMAYVLLIEPNAPEVVIWSKDAAGHWASRLLTGLEAAAELPELGVRLPLVELYDGIAFSARLPVVPPAPL